MKTLTRKRTPTTRQRKMSANVGIKSNYQAMKDAGYSDSYARSGHVKNTQGWQGMVDEILPDNELLKVHRGLLKSKEWRAREAGLDKAYKLKKRYTEQIKVENKLAHLSDEELEAEYASLLSELLSSAAKDLSDDEFNALRR